MQVVVVELIVRLLHLRGQCEPHSKSLVCQALTIDDARRSRDGLRTKANQESIPQAATSAL